MKRIHTTLSDRPRLAASRLLPILILFGGLAAEPSRLSAETDTETCVTCHDDPKLVSESGKPVGLSWSVFKASVHGGLDCVDCHSAPGNYENIPHYQKYEPVQCTACHSEAVSSFYNNFHGRAFQLGNPQAPGCLDCHATDRDPHALRGLNTRTSEDACKRCHTPETALYDESVHAGSGKGNNKPGCITCHQTHGPGLPPAAGGINALCETCHPDAMEQVKRGAHGVLGEKLNEIMNCASCHEVHGTHRPHLSSRVSQACINCHQDQRSAFEGSVHEKVIASGEMTCVSCHSTHMDEKQAGRFDAGCGACHTEVEEAYRGSVHRLGRLRGSTAAATCADCHSGHHVLAASDSLSPIYSLNIPGLCGKCHGKDPVITSNFVHLPVSLPNYLASIHHTEVKHGVLAAVCTDCHGTHDMKAAQDPESSINRFQLATTCGRCHGEIEQQYRRSIHGEALAMGIKWVPACTGCHNEHLILKSTDPKSPNNPSRLAEHTCGTCHTNPELVAWFGINSEVTRSYLDSYHGWAMKRGSPYVATCVDCHNIHEIKSPLDPTSSVNQINVVRTCGRCHERTNPTFAQSYTHESALQHRGVHGWVRLIYLFLIAGVLGGMALHNLIVVRYELKKHFERRAGEPYVIRWYRAERVQHLVLLASFIGLGVTGFALRFPKAWWVGLVGLAEREDLRQNLHRALALILIVDSIYHFGWVLATRRGRWALGGMAPRFTDVRQVFQNLAFYLGLRKERPRFDAFDYTQKAEYWAVVWGTWVMAITGFVLWFPAIATSWLPAWSVRVAEVIHFYEAILAVSAIVIWHFFYVIFMPSEYPLSTVWVNGRMPAEDWKEMHRGEYLESGDEAVKQPPS